MHCMGCDELSQQQAMADLKLYSRKSGETKRNIVDEIFYKGWEEVLASRANTLKGERPVMTARA